MGNNKNIVNKCPFCKEENKSEDCETVKDSKEPKKVLIKLAKCFIYLKPGHIAFQCSNKTSFSICNDKHHYILSSNVS